MGDMNGHIGILGEEVNGNGILLLNFVEANELEILNTTMAEGRYSFSRLHHTGRLKLQQFGPIVREKLPGNVSLLLLFDPEDIEVMYAKEGRYPYRRSHTALQKYRLDRPHMFSTGGLLPTNGKHWWELRRRAQKSLSRVSAVTSRLPNVDEVCREFAEVVGKVRREGSGRVAHFMELQKRVFLELTITSLLDVRLGNLTDHNEEVEALMEAAQESNNLTIPTDNGLQLWHYVDTSMYRRLVRAQDTMYRIALKYVEAKDDEVRHRQQREKEGEVEGTERKHTKSVLESFFESGLEDRDIVGLVSDTLLAGIDTGAYTLSYVLYCLANNPEKQDLLATEAKRLLGTSSGKVTTGVLGEARYLKAVLKETYRLHPVSIGVGRMLQDNTVIRGFKIPKDTVVVTQNQVSSRLPQYFPEPQHFLPERWLHKAPPAHPFLVLPFGHGPRSCIGRRMAEQNLQTVILQLISRYRVRWMGGELDCVSNLINEPDGPLEFTFTDRDRPHTHRRGLSGRRKGAWLEAAGVCVGGFFIRRGLSQRPDENQSALENSVRRGLPPACVWVPSGAARPSLGQIMTNCTMLKGLCILHKMLQKKVAGWKCHKPWVGPTDPCITNLLKNR
ncbi:Cytochrome P450 302a1, mitochondrial [Chionoecetes opilio]|uniref:Cytochrome P450 302a1, mitochondrial n=1 Tax=Chionoecetes opilio TaxID=41210 RepID=A0A8J4Y1P5_CHIOP|nr:Cytochrome P450 302a1, mitochondrial [Chionoecetes opilio]